MPREHFNQELEAVHQNLIEMGENTIALLVEADRAIAGTNGGSAELASELEAQTDHQHRLIHDQCVSLIMLQGAGGARRAAGDRHSGRHRRPGTDRRLRL